MIRPAFPFAPAESKPDTAAIERFERLAQSRTWLFQPVTVNGLAHVTKGLLLTGATYAPELTMTFDRQRHRLVASVDLGGVRALTAPQLVTLLRTQDMSAFARFRHEPGEGQLAICAAAPVFADRDAGPAFEALIVDLQILLSDDRLHVITGR